MNYYYFFTTTDTILLAFCFNVVIRRLPPFLL
jgi:hypothetical protein